MTEPKTSILATERAEGYRDGVGQATAVCYDEAYYAGQCDARAEAPSRLRWFMFGAATTAPVGLLLSPAWWTGLL